MAGTGTRPDSASWLRNITHGSEENNDTAGRNARFGGSTSPFNRGSMRSLQGASNASRGTRRQTYPDSRSPSSARFAYSPSAAPSGAPPPPTYPSLFTWDEGSFRAWIQTQAPPECVLSALEDEPMPGAEFKMWLSRVKYGEYTAKAFLHHCKVHVSRFQIKKIPLKSDKN